MAELYLKDIRREPRQESATKATNNIFSAKTYQQCPTTIESKDSWDVTSFSKKITHPLFTVRHLSFETMLHIQGRLELGADVCLTCFIVQDAEGELVQGYWDCSTVATVLYKSKNIHKCMLRLREAHPEICETHKRLWPQIQIPAVVQGFKQPQGETKALAMTTSWLISTLVWQFSTLKRSQDDRGIAAKVLIAIVQLCCRTGVIFNFLQFNCDQSFQWVPETMDQSGRAAHCWTLDFRNYVGEKWDFQRISGRKTWLTSPMSEATVWEFILFGLDPVKTRSCDRKLKAIKSMLVRTALNLCTEVAAFLDLNLEELSSPWSLPNIKGQKTKNKKRLHPWQLNSVAGHVFEMLRTGEDLWLHSFPTWMLYIEMDLGATLFILIYKSRYIDDVIPPVPSLIIRVLAVISFTKGPFLCSTIQLHHSCARNGGLKARWRKLILSQRWRKSRWGSMRIGRTKYHLSWAWKIQNFCFEAAKLSTVRRVLKVCYTLAARSKLVGEKHFMVWALTYFGEETALCSFFAPTTQVLMDGSSIAKVQSLGVFDVRHAMTTPTLILHVLLCSPALRLSTRDSWCLGAVRALLPLGDWVGSGRICSNLSKILSLWQFESVESLPKQKVWHDSSLMTNFQFFEAC